MLVELTIVFGPLDAEQEPRAFNPRHVVQIRPATLCPGVEVEEAQSFVTEMQLVTGEVLRVAGSPTEVRKRLNTLSR